MKKLSLLFLLLAVLLLPSMAGATTYYVRGDCTTGGTGTSQTCDAADGPFKTVAAMQAAVTGDQSGNSVLFYKGGTWRETFTIAASGTAGNLFTIGAYGAGAAPIITGGELLTSWTAESLLLTPAPVQGIAPSGLTSTGTTSATKAWASTPIEGNLLVALVHTYAAAPAMTGWTQAAHTTFASDASELAIFYKIAGAAEGDVTTDVVGAATNTRLCISEWSGIATTSSLDQVGTTSAAAAKTTIILTLSGATTVAKELIIAYASQGNDNGGTMAWTESMTVITSQQALGYMGAYKVVTSTGSYHTDPSWTTARYAGGVIASFKASGVAATAYYATCAVEPKIVLQDGVLLTAAASKAALAVGQFFWESGTTRLYVRTAADTDPTSTTVEIAQRDYGVTGAARQYLNIQGLSIKMVNSRALTLGANNTVDGNTISYAYGSLVYIQSGGCTVKNNTLSYGYKGITISGGGNLVYSNTITKVPFQAAMVDQYPFPIDVSGTDDGTSIYNNSISDFGDFGTQNAIHGIYVTVGTVSNINIYGNTITGAVRGNGIKFIGASGNIYKNRISNCRVAGIAVDANSVATDISVNIYYNILTGSHYGFNQSAKGTGDININFYNNTLYLNNSTVIVANAYSEIKIDDDVTGIVIKNNVLWADTAGYTYNMVAQSAATINNNLLYQASGDLIYYNGGNRNFATWQGYGFDTAGVNADPLFVNAAGGDFRVSAGSPAINAGAKVGLLIDFNGDKIRGNPDIGAFECDQDFNIEGPSSFGGQSPNWK